jgi:hypothetical protein
LLSNVVNHKNVPKTKVDSHVFFNLVHVGGVDENRSITPLHEAIMEKQMQLNFGMFSYRNRIPKLKRFPRIGRNMNAYLRRMHRQKKKTPPLPQAPIKLIIAHKNDNKHKGKCNLFCRLGFEIAKTCKPSST